MDNNISLQSEKLNKSQRKFCKAPITKNIRLLAPAGSGKTYSLLWRCKFIANERLRKNQPNPNFLIVTFTRAAKLEIENRINNDEDFKEIHATVRTLNSWGWEQLKNKPGKELITNSFALKSLVNHDLRPLCQKYERIYATLKSARGQALNAPIIIELINLLKSLGFTHYMKKREYNSHIKYLKELGLYSLLYYKYSELYRIEKVNLLNKTEREDAESEFFSFWKEAVVLLEANNRFTLEDQKYWARINLEEKIALGKFAYSNVQYSNILIDEFQDINPLDIALLKAISLYHGKGKMINMTIIGDDDQAIFGWRGTTPKYILYPDKYFDIKFDTYVLDTNYRSPKKIVEYSSKLISYNKERVYKEMKSAAKGRAYVKVLSRKKSLSTMDATMAVLDELINKKKCKSVALIGRRQVTLFPYQVLLSSKNITYNVDVDLDIFEGEAMKALQAIIQIIYRARVDDNDSVVDDFITVCDKIDRFQIQNKEKQSIRFFLEKENVDTFVDAIQALRNYPELIKNQNPSYLCDAVLRLYNSRTVYEFMEIIINDFKGFEQNYMKAEEDNHYKNPQFDRLKDLSKKYSDLKQFYRDIDKARRNSEISRKIKNAESDDDYLENLETCIHLLTATRSKGREFDAVIILDADDNEWPNSMCDDIEEERRLFYVAMSRAKEYLYFTYSEERTASRFLLETGLV